MDNNTRPLFMMSIRGPLQIERYKLKNKGIKKDIPWTWKQQQQQQAGIAILILGKIDFKSKFLTRHKESPQNSTSEYLSKESQNTKSKRQTFIYSLEHYLQ